MTASVTIKELRVAVEHAAFAGHFPGFPLLPGAALLDSALHEVALSRSLDLSVWRLATAKFLAAVRPGEILTLEHSAADAATIRFMVSNAQGTVASGVLTAAPAMRPDHGA